MYVARLCRFCGQVNDTGDPDRQKLNHYASRTARELSAAGFGLDELELFREQWVTQRSGFLGLGRQKSLVRVSSAVRPGWRLLEDFYDQRDVYSTDYLGKKPRRGIQSHELVCRDSLWLTPSGELWSYFVTHEIVVLDGMRRLAYESSDHHSGPSPDWHLQMFDHWRRMHTRKFGQTDFVRETFCNNGRERYPHRFQGASRSITELRRRAGTYVDPSGRR